MTWFALDGTNTESLDMLPTVKIPPSDYGYDSLSDDVLF